MLSDPSKKYRPVIPFADDYAERTWPTRRLSAAPIWMSTDLRDGNQSLIEPMDSHRKMRFFKQLIAVGLKEIEVAFPSASQTDFDFVRELIDDGHIPADVTIEVITQSRPDLIARTFEACAGARRVIVHLYNAIAPAWRRLVFNMTPEQIKQIALDGTAWVREQAARYPDTEWVFQYSPETFSMAEPEFALDVCNAVIDAWQPTPERKMIINLPTTVECTTPNLYADQIEYMHRRLHRREALVLSVHPHNDRGTGVAAAELALLAGADRVEGCLFGNGERTGNVDLVTLALNLYTQGVPPGLDFSDIDAVRQCVEHCNQLPVHPRHPYGGDLVYTAFSGSHQDAIRKGFAQQQDGGFWEVPYLPIDPADLGRTYDAVIRVNSQSGKGGITYLLEQEYGLALPRRLQIEFSRAVQQLTDSSGSEVDAATLYRTFEQEYLQRTTPLKRLHHSVQSGTDGQVAVTVTLALDGQPHTRVGQGDGALAAFIDALGVPVRVMDFHEHAIGQGASARAACYVELRLGEHGSGFGAGVHSDILTASFDAVLSAVNRQWAAAGQTLPV